MKKLRELVNETKISRDIRKYEETLTKVENEFQKNSSSEITKDLLLELLLSYGVLLSDEYDPHYMKAIKIFNRIIEIDKLNYRAYYNLGIIHFHLEKNKKALKYFKKSLKIKPDYKFAMYNIGLLHESKKNPQKAIKYYKKALKVDKDFSYAKDRKKHIENQLED